MPSDPNPTPPEAVTAPAFEAVAAVIGGGPAGLMAAEALAAAGVPVAVYDAMPSVGRKFLLAGKGGLNLTHAEPLPAFLHRYAAATPRLTPMLQAFGPQALRDWASALGIETFVGSSGRVFPREMKAAPLLRAWLHRLRGQGVRLHMRHRWQGWDDAGALLFDSPSGPQAVRPAATVLALGGASWPQLGSDGRWWPWLAQAGVDLAPLLPSNCGFDADWSPGFAQRYAGHPLKTVAIAVGERWQRGEFVVTRTGVEGSLVYAASAGLRNQLLSTGRAVLQLDLLPDRSLDAVRRALEHPRGARSWSSQLRVRLKLEGVKAGLLWERVPKPLWTDAATLAAQIKSLPIELKATRPLAEAISTAGGLRFAGLDEQLMLLKRPGVFAAGEMLDWEAPTGGYLLTACLATGRWAGQGAARWLARQGPGVLTPAPPA